jgi:hypothetical protein
MKVSTENRKLTDDDDLIEYRRGLRYLCLLSVLSMEKHQRQMAHAIAHARFTVVHRTICRIRCTSVTCFSCNILTAFKVEAMCMTVRLAEQPSTGASALPIGPYHEATHGTSARYVP